MKKSEKTVASSVSFFVMENAWFFPLIILSLLVGSAMAAEKVNDVDAFNFVDAFLQTIMQDEFIPYEFDEKFFWGNPWPKDILYIEAGNLDDRTGEWIGPRPKASLLGKLLQRNKTLFNPPDNSTEIRFSHHDEKANTTLVIYLYYVQPFAGTTYGMRGSNPQIAKTMIFNITNFSRLGIDLMHSSINGMSIPAQIGFQIKQDPVQAAGKIKIKIRPTLPKELLESLTKETIMP